MSTFIPQSLTISNTGGSVSAITYTLNGFEELSSPLEITPLTEMVDANRELLNGYDFTFELFSFDLALLSDTRLQKTSTVITQGARFVVTGGSGSQSMTIDGCFPVLVTDSEIRNGRRGVRIRATGRRTTTPATYA